MELSVYNQKGIKTETIQVSDGVFGLKWNADLVHQVVTSQAANARKNVAHTKGRSDVRGGGKKPWRQKGTGRARHGSIRSPIWRGGGVTHGPTAERDFSKKINKKMAKKALYIVLSAKARDNEIVIVDDMKFSEQKTKHAAAVFSRYEKQFPRITKGRGVLIALEKMSDGSLAFRNLPYAGTDEARNLNAHEVMQYRYVLFPKHVIEKIQ